MRLTKLAHACVVLERGGTVLLIDPGTFVPDRAALLARADAVLVTHDHFDHLDVEEVASALRSRPALVAYGPERVVHALRESGAGEASLVRVEGGEELDVAGIPVRVLGGGHAPIHDGIPVPHNVGYLVDGEVFHPGDSYATPPFAVGTLLVPVSGPWVKLGEAMDFIEAVAPRQTVAVHDAMLSDLGRRSASMFLGESAAARPPMLLLADGDSIEI